MSIEPEQLVEFSKQVLSLMGVTECYSVNLTYAFKIEGIWKVNFSYQKQYGSYEQSGSYAIDAENGEIKGMWLDRVWK